MAPVWGTTFFASGFSGLKPLWPGRDGFEKVADNLRSVLGGLKFLNSFSLDVNEGSPALLDPIKSGKTNGVNPSKPKQERDGYFNVEKKDFFLKQNGSIAMKTFLHERPTVHTSDLLEDEIRAVHTSIEILELFAKICQNSNVLKRVDSTLRDSLVKKYLSDFIDLLSDSSHLSRLYLFCAENGITIPEFSNILQPGEQELFNDIIMLKTLQSDAERGIQSSPIIPSAETLIKKMESSSHILSLEYLQNLLPTFARGQRFDQYLELLTARLKYLDLEKASIEVGLIKERKLLEKEESRFQANPGIANSSVPPTQPSTSTLFDNSATPPVENEQVVSVAAQKIRELETRLALVLQEMKEIYMHVFTMLYTVAGVEVTEEEVVKLPNVLQKIGWINWLWSLLYCNKKVVYKKPDFKDRVGGGKGLAEFQDYVVKRGSHSQDLLVMMLKRLLNSDVKEFRQTLVSWLMKEGKTHLINLIDNDMADKRLSIDFCELIKSEGIINSSSALATQKIMLDNLKSRGEVMAVAKLVQDMVDNDVQTRELDSQVISLLLIFQGKNSSLPSILSKQLSLDQVQAFISTLQKQRVLTNKERLLYLREAKTLLAPSNIVQKEAAERAIDDRISVASFQQIVIDEIDCILNTLDIQSRVTQTDCTSVKKRIELIRALLNYKLWEKNIIRERVVRPLEMNTLIALDALDNPRFTDAQTNAVLVQAINDIITSCAQNQTISNVKANLKGEAEVKESCNPLSEINNQEQMEGLEELWKAQALWPTNVIAKLTPVLTSAANAKRQGIDILLLLERVLIYCELVNSINPYMQLLLADIGEYMKFHQSGIAEPDVQNPRAAPYLRLLKNVNSFWVSDIFTSLAYKLDSGFELPIHAITKYGYGLMQECFGADEEEAKEVNILKIYR